MSHIAKAPTRRQHGYEGRTLGGFHLVREIACGGMATVYLGYKAQHAGVRQVAAVKVIHPHLARDEEFVEMFLDEARIVSCVSHPNVCRVLDFGKSDGTYYLAMEYVMGETWAEVSSRMSAAPDAEPMMVPVLAHVLAQACEGLHAAHDAQDAYGNPLRIVHRDVSPHNVMIGYDGSVRVLDFGIASAADRLHTTRAGAVKGRLSYMAPEQMRGLPVDRRADVWSLGVMLWEGLARKRLFPGNNEAKTVLAVTHGRLPPLTGSGHPIPGTLTRIVERALQRDRESRHDSARELGLALSRFAVKATAPIGMPEVSEWMHRLFAEEVELKRALLREAADVSGRAPGTASWGEGHDSLGSADLPTRLRDRDATSSGVRAIARQAPTATRWTHALTAALLLAAFLTQRVLTQASPQLQPDSPVATASSAIPTAKQAKLDSSFEKEPDLTIDLSEIEERQEAWAKSKAAMRATKTGVVSIATPGTSAEVYLGARKLGTTPLRLSLPAGVHTLRLRRFGSGPEVVRRVTVEGGVSSRLKVPMD